jgi:DNA repair protein RadA/Sms
VFGEVGLAGEVRAATQAESRLREAAQLGFTRCVLPEGNIGLSEMPGGIEAVGVKSVGEALDALMS